MGFGYLLLGYIISLNFVYQQLTMLPATLLILLGMLKLSQYNRPLKEALLLLCPTAAVAAISFVYEGGRMFGLIGAAAWEAANNVLSPLVLVLYLLFTWRLLAGIMALGKETDLPQVVFRARRGTVLTLVSYALYIFLELPITAGWYDVFAMHAALPALLFHFVVMILNARLIFTCYRMICLPEDVDMPRHKTGIGFLDRLNDRMDEREERALAEKKQAMADLYHKREAQYREKQANKKGKKK